MKHRDKRQGRLTGTGKALLLSCSVLICVFISTTLYGDVIVLKNNSLITCKVIRELDKAFLFANYDGTFKISDEHVKRIYVTGNYKEDIEIYRKFGKKVIPDAIRRDYESGLRVKMGNRSNTVEKKDSKKKSRGSAVRKSRWRGGSSSSIFGKRPAPFTKQLSVLSSFTELTSPTRTFPFSCSP